MLTMPHYITFYIRTIKSQCEVAAVLMRHGGLHPLPRHIPQQEWQCLLCVISFYIQLSQCEWAAVLLIHSGCRWAFS